MCRRELLNNIKPCSQEKAEVFNSPLNEAGVLGFEYGFSLGIAGAGLVAWEAQFGDFANNAQAMVDQFVASGKPTNDLQTAGKLVGCIGFCVIPEIGVVLYLYLH